MKGFLVGLSKLVFGVFLALILMSLAGVATARYFMSRLSLLPPKPMFENDAPVQPVVPPTGSPLIATTASTQGTPIPPATPLTAGAYKAVVSQPIGLVLREGPGTTFRQLAGIDHNTPLVVLEESPDKQWLHVRLEVNGQEGWVKAGNIRKVE
jgi:uncharacterized protein YgiM (DUF1202 family)